MGTLFVDKLDPQSGTSLELGSSGDTVAVNTGATTNLAGNVTLGASGKTITIPSGATITNSGTATGFGESNTPAFFAYRGSNQSISAQTYVRVSFNYESYDTDNAFDPNTTQRFTVPSGKAGKYHFDTTIRMQGFNEEFRIVPRKNGGDLGYYNTKFSTTGQTFSYGISFDIDLAVSDYIEIYAWHNGGSGINITGDTSNTYLTTFSGFRITT